MSNRNMASPCSIAGMATVMACLATATDLTIVQIRDRTMLGSTTISEYLCELRRAGKAHKARRSPTDRTYHWAIGPKPPGVPDVPDARREVRQATVKHIGGVARRDPLVAALFGACA